MILDIHTHNIESGSTIAILNSPRYIPERIISLGIHPWDIDNDWEEKFHIIEKLASNNNVVAIGECGIDKIRPSATVEVQRTAFRAHAKLAAGLHKPLIIHCVKAFDEIIAERKSMNPGQPWIIHGFRGKPQQAQQLLNAGFHISLGERFNAESAMTIPPERLFIESDESIIPIESIYAAIAKARGTSSNLLKEQTTANASIFGQF